MFSRILRNTSRFPQPVLKYSFASTRRGGNLYTWGTRSAGLGLATSSGANNIRSPQRLEEFDNNVAKVAMGPSHTAVLTTDGQLYTFGVGDYGVLGHRDGGRSRFNPKLVEFFNEHNIRVQDVVVGQHHTAALAEDGSIYTWGYGGQSKNFLANWFSPSYGALGLGASVNRDVPTLVEDLPRGLSGKKLFSGYNFCGFLDDHKDVYNWGVGTRGVFADESHKNLKSPILNETLHHMKEDGHKIVKIKACGNSILALFDDGSLYGWGDNRLAQLGIKKAVGVELYEHIFYPEKVNDATIPGRKIVDFDLGEELSVILTDTNEVFWAGLKLAYQYERVPFPEGLKIKKVVAANPGVLLVTENNEIYSNDLIIPQSVENPQTGVYKTENSVFRGGEVLDIGGAYTNKFAIVKN